MRVKKTTSYTVSFPICTGCKEYANSSDVTHENGCRREIPVDFPTTQRLHSEILVVVGTG